jgi:hypothetical protein
LEGAVLAVLVILVSMITLIPSTSRAVRQKRVIRRRNAVIELQYTGEVVRKAPSVEDERTYFGQAGPHFDITVRCDDGRTVTASLPIAFDKRIPVGGRVVKRSGRLWPDEAYGLPKDPRGDSSR